MAAAARAIICELAPQKAAAPAGASAPTTPSSRRRDAGKVVLQPRLCTLRSYGSGGMVTRRMLPAGEEDGSGGVDAGGSSPFFASLADYIESSRKSQDFETISGRLAMVSNRETISLPRMLLLPSHERVELMLLRRPSLIRAAGVRGSGGGGGDDRQLAVQEAGHDGDRGGGGGVCGRGRQRRRLRLGQMFTLGCNAFVDSLIDNIVEALFSEGELQDWSDDV